MVKYATLHFNAEDTRMNLAQLRKIYAQNETSSTANFRLLHKWSGFFIGLCKIMCASIIFVGAFLMLRPCIVYWLTNERIMIVPIWVPGVDETTANGYALTSAYHVFVVVLAIVGTIGSDTMFVMFVLHIWPMCEIFANSFADINDAAHIATFRESLALKAFIRNAMQMHSEICSYNSRLANIYFYQCLVEVNSNGISLCACVFCIFVVSVQFDSTEL